MNIQYGCGLCSPEGWLNYDASPTLRLQRIPLVGKLFKSGRFPAFPDTVRYGNIVSGLPLPNGQARKVYCSHVLEHLALEDLRTALKNTYNLLTPGGTFRFVLPDLEYYIKRFLNHTTLKERSIEFMENTLLGRKSRKQGVEGLLRSWLGGSEHLWMWDFHGIEQELLNAGFVDIRRAVFGDSKDNDFDSVEDKGRWGDNLGVQCIKPIR